MHVLLNEMEMPTSSYGLKLLNYFSCLRSTSRLDVATLSIDFEAAPLPPEHNT